MPLSVTSTLPPQNRQSHCHAAKMIDLLNERKQIIIQNAVTKGLDENVEMKDSNCKFLGKIPSTWEVCKTLYVCLCQ